ncbi:MAG: flippase-like domain-containing protein [Anaerolineae bacterium]|nr:flippase-like domain-containing protein [Anaerolineae bacterium]
MKKNRWQLWLGIVVSVAALALALLGIDPRQVMATLAEAQYVYLIPALASSVAYLVARSVRWRVLLGPQVSLMRCFWVTNIGYLVSNVLPFRLGDPARAVAIGLDGKVKVSAALSAVVVELVLDMLMVVSLLAVTLPFVEQVGLLQSIGIAAGAAAVVAMGVLVVVAIRPDWLRLVARWFLAHVPRLDSRRWLGVLDGLLDGLGALRSPRRFVALLGWSAVAWGLIVGYYWAMLWAFRDRPPLVQGSLFACAVGLGMALPSAPGAVGVFHSAGKYALQLPFGIPGEEAFSIAFAAHALQYIFSSLLGLIGLTQLGLSMRQLRADAVAVADAAAAATSEDK